MEASAFEPVETSFSGEDFGGVLMGISGENRDTRAGYVMLCLCISGWRFGTFFIFLYIGDVIIPIDVHIFQRV